MPRRGAASAPITEASQGEPQPVTFTDGLPLPKLLVFDLDYTLWPFWVDTHVSPPLKAQSDGQSAKDRWGESFAFYRDIGSVFDACRCKGIKIGAASRTHTPDLARDMLKLLHISSSSDRSEPGRERALNYFDYLQLYPGSKITHFKKLHDKSGISYEEMLFFDDESRNRDVESLGVIMRLVRDGVTRDEVDEGVRNWRKRNNREHV